METTLEQRIWSRIQVGLPDECWPWLGTRTSDGYGQISVDGKMKYVTRLLLDLTDRSVVARHTCDNPPCCNPRHLVSGSQADNVRDRVERNPKHNGRPRSTARQQASVGVRAALADGASLGQVAAQFQITKTMVRSIRDER